MTAEARNAALASDFIDWCKAYGLWHKWDCTIVYFNGIAWSTEPDWGKDIGVEVKPGVFEYERNPRKYMAYCNPNTVAISFDGRLYEVFNYGFEFPEYADLENEVRELFEKHGFYFEFGDAWNISAYNC